MRKAEKRKNSENNKTNFRFLMFPPIKNLIEKNYDVFCMEKHLLFSLIMKESFHYYYFMKYFFRIQEIFYFRR